MDNNNVYQVLVTKAGQDVMAKDKPLGDLALGQIGVFSYETNLSVDAALVGTNPEDMRKFFLALGIDDSNSGAMNNVLKSNIIEREKVNAYNLRCYNPAQEWIFDLVDFTAECDADYNVKFVLDNGALRQLSSKGKDKMYLVHTGCCDDCAECPSGDCVELAELIVDKVTNDEDNLFTASAIAPNTGTIEVTTFSSANQDVTFTLDGVDIVINMTGGSNLVVDAAEIAAAFDALDDWSATTDGVDTVTIVKNTNGGADSTLTYVDTDTSNMLVTIIEPTAVLVTDYAAWKIANADGCLGVRFTSALPGIQNYCGINPNYVKFREFEVTPTSGDSFECNGTWIEVQVMSHEEGSGYDIAWEEYEAGGWAGNPGIYRQSALHGLPRNINLNAVDTSKYVMIDIESMIFCKSGFDQPHWSPVTVRVAVPNNEDCHDNLIDILDAVLNGFFGPLAGDIDDCPTGNTTINMTEDKGYDLDGIG